MKVVVIGGGTAGWLAALFFKKVKGENRQVTIIDDSKSGPIGTGEAGTGLLTDVIQNRLWNFDCNEDEFFAETDSTLKVGIRHQDWKTIGEHYIGPIDQSMTGNMKYDIIQLHALANDIPLHKTTINGLLTEKNNATFFENGLHSNIIKGDIITRGAGTQSHAYNFDGFKVGKYLKKVCVKGGVEHIDNRVSRFTQDENGNIKSAILENNVEIEGDFFVDATGFRKAIWKDVFNMEWKSYKEFLPVDRAMPFILPHADTNLKVYMQALAQKNGWTWRIPTQQRWGNGYVYSSEFCSDDQALEEMRSIFGPEVEPVKFIKFDAGRYKKMWHKNAIVVGLAASFNEPLEATSIQSTIVGLWQFCYLHMNDQGNFSEKERNEYNDFMNMVTDGYTDFINAHYAGGRTDTEFWRYMNTDKAKTPFVQNLLEICKHRIPNNSDYHDHFGSVGTPLYNVTLAGLGRLNKQHAIDWLKENNLTIDALKEFRSFYTPMDTLTNNCMDYNKFLRNYIESKN